jgi:predicted metal-dependent peptidase
MANITEDANLSAEQRLTKARLWIISNPEWRYMASIVTLGKVTVTSDPDNPTARTDGLDEEYNREFIMGLTREQIRFLVLHENFHKMFRHMHVWIELFKKDANIANIACDAVINNQYLIGRPDLKFIEGGVDMPEYADPGVWNTRKVFEDLLKNANPNSKQQSSLDQHDWEKAQQRGEAETKAIEQQIDSAIRQAAMAGYLDANTPRGVQEMLVPEVDWRTLLAEFVKSRCAGNDKQSWRRPHKNYLPYDLYIPTPYSEALGKVLIAVDTSGSIGDEMLSVFLGHAQHLCNEVQPDGVDIVWWGTNVVGVDSFKREAVGELAKAVNPRGGGGTEPACITRWLDKQKDPNYICAIVLTDGEFYNGNVGNWGDLPVLWLVVNNRDVGNIPVGVTVKVKELR